jgi:hypothetical protein
MWWCTGNDRARRRSGARRQEAAWWPGRTARAPHRPGHAVNTSGKFFLPGLTAAAAAGQYHAVHVGIFVEERRR